MKHLVTKSRLRVKSFDTGFSLSDRHSRKEPHPQSWKPSSRKIRQSPQVAWVSAITNRGQMYFMVFKRRFRAEIFLEFLRRLVRQVGRRVFLILDQDPVHKAPKVLRWLRRYRDSIRVFHLPSYSRELNPDEFLNQDVKSNAVGRSRPHTQEEMVQGVLESGRSGKLISLILFLLQILFFV